MLTLMLLMGLTIAEGCNGPGPLTATEVRWRWRHGEVLSAVEFDGGVKVEVACPAEHGDGLVATVAVLTREIREFERRDPLFRRRDPFQLVAWRRCADEAEHRAAIKPRLSP